MSRMGDLRADIGGHFWCTGGSRTFRPQDRCRSGNLKGFLRKAGRKFGRDAVIWKGDDQDVVLFALKEWPALGLRIGDKKNLWGFRPNRIGQYHTLLARGKGGAVRCGSRGRG
jgi:hypothetical protein